MNRPMDMSVEAGAADAPASDAGPDLVSSPGPTSGPLVNLVLSGKGGIGKSYICGILAEYYQSGGRAALCLDTDPSNRSLCRVKSLGAEAVRLGERRNEIDPRRFDDLVERLLSLPGDGVAVVDTGSSAFGPLCAYLESNGVVSFLREAGLRVRLHGVLAGGKMYSETVVSLASVLDQFDAPMVVWINEHFGEAAVDGARFEESDLFTRHADRLEALVRLERLEERTFRHDIDQLGGAGLTFAEGMAHSAFTVMARQRIKMVWDRHRAAMAEARL